MTLTVSGAFPNALTGLVIGFAEVNVPFKGGVLIPAADVLVLGLATNGSGELTLPGLWPTGLAPCFTFVRQSWIADPGGPAGFSATNGLSAITP